jgi:hypothetical protein
MPDHPFENLGGERFQEFCQALLLDEYPDLQCLPVGQPDGGRDAMVSFEDRALAIFQVKFSRRPGWLKDPERWANDLIEGERAKIDALVERGATRYVLLTNMSGSAHMDSGAVDRVQKVLDKRIPIPASCWWRDDINRRLESAFDLKLSYPELFTGADFLRVLIDREHSGEEQERRRLTIKAYIAEQYARDQEVRFKQADLSNDLLGVFIEVPVGIEVEEPLQHGDRGMALAEMIARRARLGSELEDLAESFGAPTVGAGSLLLDRAFPSVAPCVVVEGAPGQGKSTMLQYVCQVHRMRILDKRTQLDEVAAAHATSPVRMPFRVDLRELAQWLVGKDPFAREPSPVPEQARTLEGFLAAQVTAVGGGAAFDVADIQAVLARSHAFLALDGLDEVADSDDRRAVVEAITAGVERLQAIAASLLTVVTSRPTSFVGAGRLPPKAFPVVRLQSITRRLIGDYTEKWMDARRLAGPERDELTTTLDAKLGQPHIRDLARNPMQLAILLNLIHRRGPALPEQRTALYSSYMEQFLDREAEKSHTVRDHRNLLTTLHGHIAWLLHCQAERSGETSRLSTEELRQIAAKFLQERGYEPELFGDLFSGALDRVGALVSRTQDSYEFEVQPLREFFAAQYLYETAPYSAAGNAKAGTKPERFDAMAPHPYWLNVTRFYAGFYDAGELDSLASRLESLHSTEPWSFTSHPRLVAASLLADWTFQQDRVVQERVVTMLKEDLVARGSVSQRYESYRMLTEVAVPNACGGKEIGAEAFERLAEETQPDRRRALAAVVNAQVSPEERKRCWKTVLRGLAGERRVDWYQTAYFLQLRRMLGPDDLELGSDPSSAEIAAVLYAEQFDAFDRDPSLSARALDVVMEKPSVARSAGETTHPLPTLAEALDPVRPQRRDAFTQTIDAAIKSSTDWPESYASVRSFLSETAGLYGDPEYSWPEGLGPWELLVESARDKFGDRVALNDLAVVAAGVTDPGERGRGHGDLFDASTSLCRRTRHARMRSGDGKWWGATLALASSDDEKLIALALALLWAAGPTLESNRDRILSLLQSLGPSGEDRLVHLMQRARNGTRAKPPALRWAPWQGRGPEALLFALLGPRLRVAEARAAYARGRWFEAECDSAAVLATMEQQALNYAASHQGGWPEFIGWAKSHYRRIGWEAYVLGYGFTEVDGRMPIDRAASIVAQAADFPLAMVGVAESNCLSEAQRNTESVTAISTRDGWFA